MVIGEFEKRMLDRVRKVAFERKHRMTIIAVLPETATKALQSFCHQRGIDFLAIVFHDEDRDLRIGKHDRHWNPHAHKLIAEQLLRSLGTRLDQQQKANKALSASDF